MVECSKTRVLAIVTVCLTTALLAVSGVFAYREIKRRNDKKIHEENAQLKYIGYFRTVNEQEIYSNLYMGKFMGTKPSNTTVDSPNVCKFACDQPKEVEGPLLRRRRQIPMKNHGCCQSGAYFIDPNTRQNAYGVVKTLVQFPTLRQYFAVQLCQTVDNCSGCSCTQESNLVMGVVLKSGAPNPPVYVSDTELDFFFFDGCCKCVN